MVIKVVARVVALPGPSPGNGAVRPGNMEGMPAAVPAANVLATPCLIMPIVAVRRAQQWACVVRSDT